MLLFANATVTINRRTGTAASSTVAPLYPNVPCLMQSGKGRMIQDMRIAPRGQAEEFDWVAIFDDGVDIREADHLTGWNPQNLAAAPELIVRRVAPVVGLLPHSEVYLKENRTAGT